MEIYKSINISKFQETVHKVKKEIQEWRVMSVTIGPDVDGSIMRVAKWIKDYFSAWDGTVFIFNRNEIFALVRCSDKMDMAEAKKDLIICLSQYKCQAMAGRISVEGLATTEMHLQFLTKDNSQFNAEFDVKKRRTDRHEKVFYVVDDDMFVRGLIRSALTSYGKVIEFADATGVIDRYLDDFPDAIFLDIHLPSDSGLHVLNDILEFDSSAVVIMLSGDSVKDNVVKSKAIGAKWFIVKPFGKEKIDEAISKCVPSVIR